MSMTIVSGADRMPNRDRPPDVGRSLRDARSRQPAAAQFFRPRSAAAWEPPSTSTRRRTICGSSSPCPASAADQIEIAVGDGAVVVAGERRLPVEARAIIHRLESRMAASSGASRCLPDVIGSRAASSRMAGLVIGLQKLS